MINMRQYANSPKIKQLITYHTEYFDATWVDEFYDVVWNIDTAQGFGLDIWSRIVGIENGRYIKSTTTELDDQAFRTLILTKALSNISDSTMNNMNKVLKNLFKDRGRCWVNDLQNMAIRYVFEFELQQWETSVLKSDTLPRPGGVLANILTTPSEFIFGFEEAGEHSMAFDQGTFLSDEDSFNVYNN